MTAPFLAGWCRVRLADGSTAIVWVRPLLLSAPTPYVIAARTKEAAADVTRCAFVARIDEFERDILVSRINAPASLDCPHAGGDDGR